MFKRLRAHSCIRASVDLLLRFHREEDGQHLFLATLLIVALAAMMVLTVHIGGITHQKMQTQNAVDAAALAAGDWQIRGVAFTQKMNDIIYVSDMITDVMLWLAVGCNAASFAPVVGTIAWAAGNILIGVSVALHAFTTFGLVPFRYLCVEALFPIVAHLSASEMARANGGTGLAGLTLTGARISTDAVYHMTGAAPPASTVGSISDVVASLAQIPFCAIGVEIGDDGAEILSLHLDRVEPDDFDWPLRVVGVDHRVASCVALHPAASWGHAYFAAVDWKHEWYETESDLVDEAVQTASGRGIPLPPSTWVVSTMEEVRGTGRYKAWSAFWEEGMGGLGVAVAKNGEDGSAVFGELGSIGIASVEVVVPEVIKVAFGLTGSFGAVQLRPVVLSPGSEHSLQWGICH